MDLKIFYAYLYFGIPEKDEILSWIENQITAGNDIHCLDQLLMLDNSDFKDELLLVLKKMKVSEESHKTLGMMAAKWIAEKIVNHEIKPYEGAKKIWFDIRHEYQEEDEFDDLMVFTGLASEYEDFNDEVNKDYYGEDGAKEKQSEIERNIIDEASQLLKE